MVMAKHAVIKVWLSPQTTPRSVTLKYWPPLVLSHLQLNRRCRSDSEVCTHGFVHLFATCRVPLALLPVEPYPPPLYHALSTFAHHLAIFFNTSNSDFTFSLASFHLGTRAARARPVFTPQCPAYMKTSAANAHLCII